MNNPELKMIADLMFQEISGAEGLHPNEYYDTKLMSIIHNSLNKAVSATFSPIIAKWEKRLERFKQNPDIAKGMDFKVASGVDSGRTRALADCIKDLKELQNGL